MSLAFLFFAYEQAAEDIHLSGDVSQLGEAAARIAINDGLAIYESRAAKAKARAEKKAEHKKATPKKGAVTLAENVKNTESIKANMPILKKIAQSGNVAIVIEKFSGAEKYAKGFYSGGVIHLNADRLTEGGFTYTGIHESVHYVSDINYEGYKAIEKFIKNYYKEKGVDIEAEIKATQNLYKQRGKELTRSEAMEEIVCNTLSDIATDEDALTAFLGLDSKTQNNFIEALKAIARKLKEWATKCLKGTEYHSIVINDADTLLSLAKQLRTELVKAGQKNNTAESSGEVKYSKNSEYAQQVEDVLNNNYDKNNHVYMGNTPQTLVNLLGIKKLPMLVTNNHIYSMSVSEAKAKSEGRYTKKTNYHDLGDTVKELPKLLNKPVAIIKSNTKVTDSTFVVVLNKTNTKGNPIIAILKPDGKGNYYNVELDSSVLLSAYGKDNFLNYLNTAWKENRFLYVNKNSQKNNTTGVQFPNNIMSTDYSNNLARFKRIVNTNSMQESSKKKHLFASTKAKTVNDSLYQQAVKLYESGESKIVIWQETGWVRGYDGEWRFEIDDSKAVFRVGGDAMQLGNSEYHRWADLLLSEKRTEAEEQEFNKLNEKFSGDFWNDKNSLQDYLIHDELYEAYPQLKDINVVCFPMSMKVGGRYNITTDTIYLNSLLDEQELKETLFHELQHKIQSIEGLAKGASTEYWQKKIDEGFDSRTADVIEEEQKLMAELEDIIKMIASFT